MLAASLVLLLQAELRRDGFVDEWAQGQERPSDIEPEPSQLSWHKIYQLHPPLCRTQPNSQLFLLKSNEFLTPR